MKNFASRRFALIILLMGLLTDVVAPQNLYAVSPGYTLIPFTWNWRMQNFEPGFPEGLQTFNGIPYTIPAGTFNIWASYTAYNGSLPTTLTVPVNVANVDKVYTLINTYYGSPSGTYAAIEFNGSQGAFYHVDLYGNVDIRDWSGSSVYTNQINGTTTINAFTAGDGSRLDQQTFTLPAAFQTQTLTTVRLLDYGHPGFQDSFLAGLTVHAVPEPSSVILMAIGVGTALLSFRKYRDAQHK